MTEQRRTGSLLALKEKFNALAKRNQRRADKLFEQYLDPSASIAWGKAQAFRSAARIIAKAMAAK